MHLKVLIFCGFLVAVVVSAPPEYDARSPNYVLVGSSEGFKEIEDNRRSRYSNPLLLHQRPSSEYQHGFYGYNPPYHHQPTSPNSLISANVHLLEPFMLVTFLLFVLSLIDKARIPAGVLARDDYVQDLMVNYTNHDDQHQRHRFLRTLRAPNETDF